MTETHSRPEEVESLLACDADLTTFNFEEFRMNLESSIRKIESTANAISRVQWWGLSIFLASVLFCIFIQWSELLGSKWFFFGCVVGGSAMILTASLAAVYQYYYAPRLMHAKTGLTSTMIKELQLQVAEINRKVENR